MRWVAAPFELRESDCGTERDRDRKRANVFLIAFGHPHRQNGCHTAQNCRLGKRHKGLIDILSLKLTVNTFPFPEKSVTRKNKEWGKLKGDRERPAKKRTQVGDTVLECPIFRPSPLLKGIKSLCLFLLLLFFFHFSLFLFLSHPFPYLSLFFASKKKNLSWMMYVCLVINSDFYRPRRIHQDIHGVIVNFNAIMASDGRPD